MLNYPMIVVTHIKADFDAISSAWAACRLYSDAEMQPEIWLCTEVEQNVHTYLKTIDHSIIKHVKPHDIDELAEYDQLIITDCKQLKRLGKLAAIVPKAKRIAIFDHHPAYAKDIAGDDENIMELGATVSILVRRLIDEGKPISPTDATLYLLGIYEDTGLLTYSSTTPQDVRLVAKLIELGGDTTVVSDFVKREFSREQVFILNELLMNMATISVDGVNITYSFASLDVYIEELAFLAHRMMDMEGLEALFIMVRSGPRIVLVGRSNNNLVDAGKIVARFGGGGHAAAAAANIKDLELHEAVELLKVTLREQIKPVHIVAEIMTSPAKYMSTERTIASALDFTLKYNLNHLPVVDKGNGKILGILSRKDILQAMKHELAAEPISLLIQTEIQIVSPATPFRIAEDILITHNQKLLPVEEAGKLVGVVSRTDILRLMYEESAQRSSYEEGTKARLGLSRTRSVSDLMRTELTAVFFNYIMDVGMVATDNGFVAYVVGGFVRDLLMGRPNTDMDIVVEGDAVIIAREYARIKGAKLTIHDKFKTATVTLATGDKIDFATSRTEFYSNPGAAPTVEFSSLRNDLYRRDFTINAMAIRIDNDEFGYLVDYFGGQRDILDKKIRVLHSLSFVDDPTRAFRALRFAARYGFVLGSNTERLLKHAQVLDLFSRIRGSKLFIELKYILDEERYMAALLLLKQYGMLGLIAPKLAIDHSRQEQFNALEEAYKRLKLAGLSNNVALWALRFALLLYNYSAEEYKQVVADLRMETTLADRLIALYSKSKYAAKKIKGMKMPRPSDIYKLLAKLSDEEITLTSVALGEKLNYLVFAYMEDDRFTKPILSGNDLKKMGVSASKEMGAMLKELLYAKLDGKYTTREQEEDYVRSRLHKLRGF